MTEYALTSVATSVFKDRDIHSDLKAQLSPGSNVAVLEHDVTWSKIIKDKYEGYCKTDNLIFENGSAEMEPDKESNLMICIPRDCACALYNALKFSLKL